MAAANAHLPGFVERYNASFSRLPMRSHDMHRALNAEPDRLRQILCLREQRYVGENPTLSYANMRLMLEINEISRGLVGKYVNVCAFADGRLQVRAMGVVLPHTVFDKNQRVTHAAVTENKHLGAVLAWIRTEQDKTPPKVTAKRTSQERLCQDRADAAGTSLDRGCDRQTKAGGSGA
jgi:hypothetical protein